MHCGSDGHSHSHSRVSGDELGLVIAWHDARISERRKARGDDSFYSFEHHEFGYLFGSGWRSRPERYPMVEDVRFVFWFDC